MKKLYCLAIVLVFCLFPLWAGEKEIFEAMQAEIQRGMEKLRIEGMEPPYFISLRMLEKEENSLSTAFGSLLEKDRTYGRSVQAVVRVGSPSLDNSNFTGEMEYGYFENEPIYLPYEDNVVALRQAFWLAIDDAYKKNLEQFSKKKGYLEKHPQEEYPPDFLPVPEKTIMIIPKPAPFQIEILRPYVQKISQHLRQYPFLMEGDVNLRTHYAIQYYCDSEGNRFMRPNPRIGLTIALRAFTQDWYPIKREISWGVQKAEELPQVEKIIERGDGLLKDIKVLLEKKPLEDYTGPVIFSGQASGKFFASILARGISRPREPLSASGENMYLNPFQQNEGFLAKRFGQKILPATFDIWDRPSETEWQGKSLIGHLLVDDEGVKSKDVQIISQGKLIGFPMRRTATKKYSEINGHARASSSMEPPEATITNLFIEDKEGLAPEAFMQKVKAAAEEAGFDEILIIASLKDDISMPESEEELFSLYRPGEVRLLSSPSEMYMLNVKTGEKKPVWGLEFTGVTEKALAEIVASTKERTLYQFVNASSGSWGDQMDVRPKSIIAPDILIKEMTLQKARVEKLRTPALLMPSFEASK